MKLNRGDRVSHDGNQGYVDLVVDDSVRVQFDHGRVGVFDRENDPRLKLVGQDDFAFTVKVTGLDLDAWARDFGIDPDDQAKIREDFEEFARSNLQGSFDIQLHHMGYNGQEVTVE
ncbi:hypothetical protein FDH96_gp123 [Mycobacterium phage Rey]|uniref:Uncharacterized protein n=1 Tax=Mycobacterium phage Rey TaxID=1034115 RepID=G1D5J6_9CAUD|nr:hypothetical protein FDH96_gp123 [Mycobacterium phage Rey]AEK10044.1 hypothetical protein PBI_REY_156 [Mycobacterium phage Rey]